MTKVKRGAERAWKPWSPEAELLPGNASAWELLVQAKAIIVTVQGWEGAGGRRAGLPGQVFWERMVSVGSWLVFQACLGGELYHWVVGITGLTLIIGRVSRQGSDMARAEGQGRGLGPPRSQQMHPGESQGSVWPGLCFCRWGPQTTALRWGWAGESRS